MKLNTLLRSLCGLSLMLAGSAALADTGYSVEKPYIGADYSVFTYKNTNSGNANESAGVLQAGSAILPYLAVEARVGSGFSKGTLTVNGVNYDATLNSVYGAYVRPQWSTGPFTIYGMLGYSYTSLTFDPKNSPVGGTAQRHDNTGTSYGGGLEFGLGSNFGVSADYLHYLSGLSAVNVGLIYHFPE